MVERRSGCREPHALTHIPLREPKGQRETFRLRDGRDEWAVEAAVRLSPTQVRHVLVRVRRVDGLRDEPEVEDAIRDMFGKRVTVTRAITAGHAVDTVAPAE